MGCTVAMKVGVRLIWMSVWSLYYRRIGWCCGFTLGDEIGSRPALKFFSFHKQFMDAHWFALMHTYQRLEPKLFLQSFGNRLRFFCSGIGADVHAHQVILLVQADLFTAIVKFRAHLG